MAIVDIELVVQEGKDPYLGQEQIQSIADTLGRIFETKPNRTWVKIRYLPGGQYAQNEAPDAVAALPAFITVLKNRPPAPDQMAGQMSAIARELAPIIGRPAASIHVLYEASARGRLGIGGVLDGG
ncbi:MAG: hypothetical protein WC997_09855 [Porticoccaceae bacterium]